MLSAIAPAHALAARRGSHPERYLPDYNAFAQLLAPMGDLDAQPIEEMALPMLLKHCSDPVVQHEMDVSKLLTAKLEVATEKAEACAICYAPIDEAQHLRFICCKPTHAHAACVFQFLTVAAENVFQKIRCPVGCDREFQLRDIHQFLALIRKLMPDLPAQKDVTRYLAHNRIFGAPEQLFICPEDGCLGVLERTGEGLCEECKTAVCLQCDRRAHPGVECSKFMEEEKVAGETKFQEVVVARKYQVCPGCKKTVERTEGCRDMNCICGTEFCYDCGKVLDWNYPEGEQYCRCEDDEEYDEY